MSKGVILCLCDISGVMAGPWIENGYEAILVDPQHPAGVTVDGPVTKVGAVIDDPITWAVIREHLHRIVFVAAFPPCTDLAVSGARWFKAKGEADPSFQFKAMQVVWQCYDIASLIGAPFLIENPVSQISTFWRRPDHRFHPFNFVRYAPDENYTKLTCLWTGNGFKMPPCEESHLGPPDDRIHKAPPSAERANIRSKTPAGFARAVFLANGEGS